MARLSLGVMTLYANNRREIGEKSYFRRLMIAGEKRGIDIFLFTPEDVVQEKIHAYYYNKETAHWQRKWTAFPTIIFDRCRFQKTARFQLLRQFRKKYPQLTYLNQPLANKWLIYNILYQHQDIRPFLPETEIYTQKQDLDRFQQRNYKCVYLKPINGTGGRGIVRIDRLTHSHCLIQGRDLNRSIIAPVRVAKAQLAERLRGWDLKNRYLMQQGIDITLEDGRVHDYRLLIQKNGRGRWEVTGCVGRVGPPRSITSNLHGGGTAKPMNALLEQRFSDETKIRVIKDETFQLAVAVADALELQYGRLCELALDIAIDRDGHVWLLEVNPKPSREVFHRIGELAAYQKAISQPLNYALWLHNQKKGAE